MPHRKTSGWWYITGYFTDLENTDKLFSYQYTFLRTRIFGITLKTLQLALTDFSEKRHYFKQRFSVFEKKFFPDKNSIIFPPYAYLNREKDGLRLKVRTDEFALNLKLDYGKGAVWHGENGILIMGKPEDPKQRTVYYSYTNMPTSGELVLSTSEGREKVLRVNGKSWFDRQWGPFKITDPETHWEWFSLRFFDDEEVMLFIFPQHPYQDGTYIDKSGKATRIRDFKCTPKNFVEVEGFIFSMGWELELPGIKEEHYEIRPLMGGQMNLAYFELMAEIINTSGERVGYCFVELLPGVRNPGKKISIRNLLKNL